LGFLHFVPFRPFSRTAPLIAVDLEVVPAPVPEILNLRQLVAVAPAPPPQIIEGGVAPGVQDDSWGHEQEQQELVSAGPGGERGERREVVGVYQVSRSWPSRCFLSSTGVRDFWFGNLAQPLIPVQPPLDRTQALAIELQETSRRPGHLRNLRRARPDPQRCPWSKPLTHSSLTGPIAG